MAPKYSEGKIYKLISDQVPNLCYVGATTLRLSARLAHHNQDYRKFQAGKIASITSFEIVKHGDAKIILLEKCVCTSKEELSARERYWIEKLNCVNKAIPGRTKNEYQQEWLQKNPDYMAAYYQNNKDKIKNTTKLNKQKRKQEHEITELDAEFKQLFC